MASKRTVTGVVTYMYKDCPKSDGWFGCSFAPVGGVPMKVTGHTTLPLKTGFELEMTVSFSGIRGEYKAEKLDIVRTPSSIRTYLSACWPGQPMLVSQVESLATAHQMDALTLLFKHEDDLFSTIVPNLDDRRMMVDEAFMPMALNEVKVMFSHLRTNVIRALLDAYGANVMRMLTTNPYEPFLSGTSVPGYTWKQAEKTAVVAGVFNQSIDRVKAAVVTAFSKYFDTYKQMCVNIAIPDVQDKILDDIVQLVGDNCPIPISMELLENMFHMDRSPFVLVPMGDGLYVYTTKTYEVESSCLQSLSAMMSETDFVTPFFPSKLDIIDAIEDYERVSRRKMDACQVDAVINSLTNRVSVLAGGPGCGKTATMSCIMYCWNKLLGGRVLLTAPTWRAVAQLTQAAQDSYVMEYRNNPCGATAAGRVFRKLKHLPRQDKDGDTYVYPIQDPFETMRSFLNNDPNCDDSEDTVCDSGELLNLLRQYPSYGHIFCLCIVDESSMLGIKDAAVLLELFRYCQVIFVGDVNQLPSIERGSFFGDLCKSKTVPMGECRVNHRSSSREIVTNFRRVLSGFSSNEFQQKDGVFRIYPYQPVAGATPTVCAEDLANRYVQYIRAGWSMFDLQVLSPTKKLTLCGSTEDLNSRIQERLCPKVPLSISAFSPFNDMVMSNQLGMEIAFPPDAKSDGLEVPYRIGDKVVAVKNHVSSRYDYRWANGDMGIVRGYIRCPFPTHATSYGAMTSLMKRESDKSGRLIIDLYRGKNARHEDMFEQVIVSYQDFADFRLGYAVTVHKSQGSGFPGVLYMSQYEPARWSESMDFMNRNMIYTAFSRPEQVLEIFGSVEALDIAIQRISRPRFSLLSNYLDDAMRQDKDPDAVDWDDIV